MYSKACVAGSIKFVVGEASENSIDPTDNDKFSCNLATILARDKEVVAVYLKVLSSKVRVYISKNSEWLETDDEYISKIQEYLKSISKDAPMSLDEALEREDVLVLFDDAMAYCSAKLEYRFEKFKKDITEGQYNDYIILDPS